MKNNSKKIIAKKKGVVASKNNAKTVIVEVNILKTHSKYKKKYISTKRYKAHDETGKYQIGDVVEIIPAKPISKDKKYKIV